MTQQSIDYHPALHRNRQLEAAYKKAVDDYQQMVIKAEPCGDTLAMHKRAMTDAHMTWQDH